jgi:hypothetical protein
MHSQFIKKLCVVFDNLAKKLAKWCLAKGGGYFEGEFENLKSPSITCHIIRIGPGLMILEGITLCIISGTPCILTS